MGGSKSKPLAETARTVIARRKLDQTADATKRAVVVAEVSPQVAINPAESPSVATKSAHIHPPILSKKNETRTVVASSKPFDGMDENILKEMSKWNMVKTAKSELPVKGSPTSAMATQVRQAEERDTKDVRKGQAIATRMTESQVSEMLSHIRNEAKNVKLFADKYGIPEDTIKKIAASVRAPVIMREGGTKDDSESGYAVAK